MENENKKTAQQGELVTVAIHTYEKAQILRSILESEGVSAEINNVSIIQPNPAGHVRVRINSNDLPKALAIIEGVDLSYEGATEEEKRKEKERQIRNEILIPVDFSDCSMKACEFGFRLAKDMDCEVKLFHAFFSPYYPAAMPFGDSYTIQAPDENLYKEVHDKIEQQMRDWTGRLKEKVKSGELPDVYFTYTLMEGLPEEEIIGYSKKMMPTAIVMGTQGNSQKEIEIIGSVTAEVIEGCKTPIFAIPDKASNRDLSKMKQVGFLTNFREREFAAIERLMKFIGKYPIKMHIIHVNKKEDVWDEIKLSGIGNFLKEKYPLLEMEYKLIDNTAERLEVSIDNFVRETNIDMLAMSSSRRNIFARMFNPGLARRMIFHSQTPLLVLKS